jgi:hypothetical protein
LQGRSVKFRHETKLRSRRCSQPLLQRIDPAA